MVKAIFFLNKWSIRFFPGHTLLGQCR